MYECCPKGPIEVAIRLLLSILHFYKYLLVLICFNMLSQNHRGWKGSSGDHLVQSPNKADSQEYYLLLFSR